MARRFGEKFGAGDWAGTAALLHDFGKANPAFQKYITVRGIPDTEAHLETMPGKVDHSTPGAILAVKRFGTPGRILAYLIAGHHAGLPDWSAADGQTGNLSSRILRMELYEEALKGRLPQGITMPTPPVNKPGRRDPALWVRMLFSCLCDADFLDTEAHFDPEKSGHRGVLPEISQMITPFDSFMDGLLGNAEDSAVNRERSLILARCRDAAKGLPGIYTLTVPTGGGKTLSGLAFALEHAAAHHKDRIIYVIPYTSIIEQTADIFRTIFPETVVEHHSNLDPDRETPQSRLAAENWDAPLLVTTSVQFFESLFASRTSRARKLHNIVNSVVVLDEVQLLPPGLLEPILHVIQELSDHYGVTFLLSTATQPALEERGTGARRFRGLRTAREIVKDPEALHRSLRRVRFEMPEDLNRPVSWECLASELGGITRVLCVVNSRRHCRELHSRMPEGTVHLSALMCGEHRSEIIQKIKKALSDPEKTVRVISTQLVEAGVDIDFPVVYRAMAGLDSLAQAAGRCNREGLMDRGCVKIFIPPEPPAPGLLRKAENTARELLATGLDDLLAPETFRRFFECLYWRANTLDEKGILELLKPGPNLEIQFRTAASLFRLIDEGGRTPILVRYGVGAGWIGRLRKNGPDRGLLRRLQRFTVSIPERQAVALLARGDIVEVWPGFLAQAHDALYHSVLGFVGEDSGHHDPAGYMA